ncbi:MAG: amidohydrolase family protein [Clostridia bacterium]|nr:amidohydrolase family protein [Clostridia bacterium]
MIVDFHTHAFPDALAAKAIAHLLENGRQHAESFGKRMQNRTDGTNSGLLASAGQAGIDCCLVLPIATSAKPSSHLNEAAAQTDRTPGLRSFGSVHPLNPDWEAELLRVRQAGLRGIKLHPEYQGCYVDEEPTVRLVRAAAELGLYVLFHAGRDVGMPEPVHGTVRRFCRLRRAVPDAPIVLAHMGGFYVWEEVLAAVDDLHAWMDTSFSVFQYPEKAELFARIIEKNTPARILFGTDCPWEDQKQSLRFQQTFLKEYGFSEAERTAILGGNAAAILGM